MPFGLDLEALQKLADDEVDRLVQLVHEQGIYTFVRCSAAIAVCVVMCLDSQARQVDAREAQVSATGCGRRTVDIGHDSGAAAHGRHFRIGISFLIELQVEGGVQKLEVREEPLCRHPARHPKEVVVWVAGFGVHAVLYLIYGWGRWMSPRCRDRHPGPAGILSLPCAAQVTFLCHS